MTWQEDPPTEPGTYWRAYHHSPHTWDRHLYTIHPGQTMERDAGVRWWPASVEVPPVPGEP